MSILLIPLLVNPSWVLFSPITRQLSYKAYEDGSGRPWASPNSFDLARVALRWGLPQSSDTDDQLASGISFAIHQDFCKRLMPLFPEQSEMDNSFFGTAFLSCNELRDAIKRGFDTWAINHKKIYFRDVSDQCADVTSYDYCPAAELWIVPDNEFATERDLAAYVTHQQSNFDRQPYSTAGELIANGIGCRNARMAVRAPTAADTNDDFCWYLDSTFCYTFHRWKDADVDVIMIARIVCVVLFILALAVVLWRPARRSTWRACPYVAWPHIHWPLRAGRWRRNSLSVTSATAPVKRQGRCAATTWGMRWEVNMKHVCTYSHQGRRFLCIIPCI